MTMVEPATLPVGGTADDTVVEPAPSVATPPVATKGWASYSNNKKLVIGAGGGVVIGVGIYIWRKRQSANAVAASVPAPGSNNTAPMYVLPSSNQDAVQGANDAALETALGSIGTTLNSIGNDVNNPPNTQVTCNCPMVPAGVPTMVGAPPCNCQVPAASGGLGSNPNPNPPPQAGAYPHPGKSFGNLPASTVAELQSKAPGGQTKVVL